MPERTPLQARVFDRVERDGYSIEKVDLQPWPGVHLGGNLYRPLNRGSGPFPAILNPHGHWSKGRLEESEICSVPGRCASFARQGMIALSIDMIGYNDSQQFGGHRAAFLHPTNALWGVSLMGLQTWNAIRALDFLESLPEVDRTRLACTGASGGGTQTFILGAIDDRLAVQVPMVMVSHSMQGGCLCENAPGLRVNYFNVEIAAAAAPRPQLLVAATGDWTRATLEMEGPAVASVYGLLGASDRFRAVRLNYNHNYNREAREIVYGWFGRWLRGLADATPIPEAPHTIEPAGVVRVFPDGSPPADALTEAAFTGRLPARVWPCAASAGPVCTPCWLRRARTPCSPTPAPWTRATTRRFSPPTSSSPASAASAERRVRCCCPLRAPWSSTIPPAASRPPASAQPTAAPAAPPPSTSTTPHGPTKAPRAGPARPSADRTASLSPSVHRWTGRIHTETRRTQREDGAAGRTDRITGWRGSE